VIQHHPHRAFPHLGRILVRRLAHKGSTFSGVGASGKPGAVQISQYRPTDLLAAPQADLARENERLRLENRVLKEERDILKKATQFFASQRP
jgi:transposase